MKRLVLLTIVLMLISGNALALTKPIDVRDYNLTYDGALGTGTLDYRSGNLSSGEPATLYRDNQDGGVSCACGVGEDRGGHPAADIPCGITPIFAIASGTVISVGLDNRGFGNTIVIRHDSSDISSLVYPQDVIYACYSHLSSISVSSGAAVYENQPIGFTGNSGPSTYHLHFQIDRHRRLDTGEIISTSNTNISSNIHPFLTNNYISIKNQRDIVHDMENYTINPMPFLQMNTDTQGYKPCYVPVGFVLNADYSGNPNWRTSGDDGVSQAFRDRYDEYVYIDDEGDLQGSPQRAAIGFPWDNLPKDENGQDLLSSYGQAVHKVDDMWIQDFYGPNNGLELPYSALIKGEETSDDVYLLKEGFWDYWMNNHGWIHYGYPITDEHPDGWGTPQQTFRKNGEQIVFSWNGSDVDVEYMSGVAVIQYNATFTGLAKTANDGVYHSGLSVTDLDVPIKLIENRTYSDFYAVIAGEQIPIAPFTVTGDMTIVVDQSNGDDIELDEWLISLNPGAVDQALHSHAFLLNTGIHDVMLSEISLELIDPNGQSVYNHSSFNVTIESGELHDHYFVFYPEMAGDHTLRISGLVNGQWYVYDEEVVFVAAVALTAEFSATPISGDAPLTVQFTDLSVGDPTSWSWNLGDNNDSTEQNPSHTYTTPGSYGVRLVTTNAYDSASEIKSNYITVTTPSAPIANFSATPTSGDAPLIVQFTDESTGGTVDSWLWDFGDGNSSNEQNPNYTYTVAGNYNVTLEVANTGGTNSLEIPNYITAASVPVLSPCVVSLVDINATNDVYVSGDYAYVANGGEGLKIFNISDPTMPTLAGSEDTHMAMGVYVSGDYAYIADSSHGLKIINISDPTMPTLAGSVVTFYALGVYVSGDYAYIADEGEGLKIVNISDPTIPVIVGFEDTYNAMGIQVSGDYAYIIDAYAGLKIINISDPTTPVISSFLDMEDPEGGLCVFGDYAYLANGHLGLKIVNISDPTTPVVISSVDTYGAEDVSIAGNYAYVADWSEGLKIVNISDLANPVIAGAVSLNVCARSIFTSEDYVYIACNSGGFEIAQKECGLFLAADFTANPTNVYTSNPIQFTDQSTGDPISWVWDFGNGDTSTEQNPIHTYFVHGTYAVSLTVGDGISSDTLALTDYITSSKPPVDDGDIYPHSTPNPFNPITVIKFKVNKPGHVSLRIFDVQGRLVDTLVDQNLGLGVHQVTFGGARFSSGTYFYMIRSTEGTEVRKIMLVK